jgi:nucleoside 2-deoxyribosyltransferase
MKKVYLAGGIWGVEDPDTWRNEVTAQLPKGWAAVNPLKIERMVPGNKNLAQRVVDADLIAIDDCDAVLALIDEPSWGTGMEIFYSHSMAIPVIGWNPKTNGITPSLWLQVHCSIITGDIAEAMKYLKNKLRDKVNAEG